MPEHNSTPHPSPVDSPGGLRPKTTDDLHDPGLNSETSEPEHDLSNLQVGEFLLLRRLGVGGMAEVYLAEQKSLGRQVAVKVLKDNGLFGTGDVLLKRFEQEARAAGGLNHSNIVQIITTGCETASHSAAGKSGFVHYIVQEYVAGLNLSQWTKKNGSPSYGLGLKWMQQIAAALTAASEAGIVHRDIKPENIMITRGGVAKVTDFGLAQLAIQPEQKMNLTQAGTTLGTPWYMSPEQIQGEKLDHRSDQYSFGVTCFHMFAGRPPFPGKNAVAVAVQHLKEEPPKLASLRADLPRELCDVIHRMMAKKADDRFQTAADTESALQKLEQVSVNTHIGVADTWYAKLNDWVPDVRWLVPALLVLGLFGFAGARKLYPAARLPDLPDAKPVRLDTATRQFAAALLKPRLASSWEEVMKFEGTPEAEMAQMRLALLYLNSPPRDFEKAMAEFGKIRKAGERPGREYLQILGIIGQAYACQQNGENEASRDLISELYSPYDFSESSTEEDLNMKIGLALMRGPVELQDFYFHGDTANPGSPPGPPNTSGGIGQPGPFPGRNPPDRGRGDRG